MPLVVGLGNPGERYAATRHNVAWHVIDRLIERWGAAAEPGGTKWRLWSAAPAGRKVALMKPLTWMNESGEAVGEWALGFGLEPEGLLVVTDDVYLPVGALRLRAHGSSGGHRGLESIERRLGHRDFARLRIGVGAAESSSELREHVLEEFSPEEAAQVEEMVSLAADAVDCWLDRGLIAAMNQFNRRKHKEEPET